MCAKFSFRLGLLFFLLIFCPSIARAVDPSDLPAGSSAEVLQEKISDEAEDKLFQEKEEEVPIEPQQIMPQMSSDVIFKIRKIHLKPSTVDLQKEAYEPLLAMDFWKPLIASYENRDITIAVLKELTRKLEEGFRAQGYLALVLIPPQRAEKGEMTLELLISRMGQVSAEGNRWFRKSKTISYWGIPPGEVILYDKMRESVVALNQNPDRTVRPLLKAGAKPGTTDIVLNVEDHFPIHGGYSLDNQGVKLTGKLRNGLTMRHNNLLSLDDVFLIGTSFGDRFGALFLNHMLPLNRYGTRLVTGFSHAQVDPQKEFAPFGINSISQTYSVQLRHMLYRNKQLLVEGFAGFNFKEKRTKILSTTSVWDRLRILSWGADARYRDGSGIWSAGTDFSYGFPLHGDGFALNSRSAETQFFKTGLSLGRLQKMPWKTTLNAKFEVQLTSSSLLPQEQMFMGGANTVRGYPESDYGADQGFIANFEYVIPVLSYFIEPADAKNVSMKNFHQQLEFNLVAFFDTGYGRLRRPSAAENKAQTLMGAGGGFEIRWRKYMSARFEWASRLKDKALTEGGDSQFHVRFTSDY